MNTKEYQGIRMNTKETYIERGRGVLFAWLALSATGGTLVSRMVCEHTTETYANKNIVCYGRFICRKPNFRKGDPGFPNALISNYIYMSVSGKPGMRTVAPFFEQKKHTKLLYSIEQKKCPPRFPSKTDRKNTSRCDLEKVNHKCMSKVTLRTTCSQQELGESQEEDTAENLG